MSLSEHLKELSERANKLSKSDDRKAESRNLTPLLNDADSLSQDLGQEIEQLRLLRDQGLQINTSDLPIDSIKTLEKIKSRFSKSQRAQELTKGKDWTAFREGLKKITTNCSVISKQKWEEFIQSSYVGQDPHELGSALAPTDANTSNLLFFREKYQALKQLERSRPKVREDFESVRQISNQLREIHQRFDFEVPDDVRKFLVSVASGGADLDLLTTDVLDWLQKKNTSHNYRIVTKPVSLNDSRY